MKRALVAGTVLLLVVPGPGPAQNVVGESDGGVAMAPVEIARDRLEAFVWRVPKFGTVPDRPDAARIVAKLRRHVREFVDGAPWRPFHHTLGISGYETYFDHPDELYFALSIAMPYLDGEDAGRVRRLLADGLVEHPPYAVSGFSTDTGRERESYSVPEELRRSNAGRAPNAFGVFSFWAYCEYGGGREMLPAHWPLIRERMAPLLAGEDDFDVLKRHERDEAEAFTGDLTGMIGLVRLARMAGDKITEAKAMNRAVAMLNRRINLERRNPEILEKSTRWASKSLHHFKVARYLDMAPAVGMALAECTDGVAATRLKRFREARNGWYLAFGPRLIGGENYTSPPHLSRALFAGAAWVEGVGPERLAGWVDVPWCRGDFYFVVKCVYALR